VEAILNEISVQPTSSQTADHRCLQLVSALRALGEHGATRALRSTRDALDRSFEGKLSLRRWLFGSSNSREERQFLARLLDKTPYVEDLEARAESEKNAAFEFNLSGERVRGLGVAYLHDVPAVSFGGDPRFEASTISVEFLELGTPDTLKTVSVIHVAHVDHVACHRPWLEQRVARAVQSGADLWERREVLFPRLDFCARVEKQVCALFGTESFFAEMVRHLHVLSVAAVDWQGGEFNPPLRWSHESKTTLSNEKLLAVRRFSCPDKVVRVFSPHSKMQGAKRVVFLPDPLRRRVWIGHVGDHLPTTLFG
jgi:hypothetical protein